MENVKQIAIADYTYELPEEKIAYHPLPERDQSKLLIWEKGQIREDIYKNISDYLPEQSLLIFNDTKVVQARILFKKETGGLIEIFCLEPNEPDKDYAVIMNKTKSVLWKCMIGGASKWKKGLLEKKIIIGKEEILFKATLKEKLADSYIAEFSWHPSNYTFAEVLEAAGTIPLPPYIKRNITDEDRQRYQTVYALHDGSVAAPTAGLHFTENIFSSLKNKNINIDFVTLHVGAGTFKPVKTEIIKNHEMHAEWIDVSVQTIENILNNSVNIIAVGTTSARTIESLYWMGVKIIINENITPELLEIKQWEVYEYPLLTQYFSVSATLSALLKWLKKNNLERLIIKTQILIVPGYVFRIVKALVTNFHQPRSTLLLLVAAAAGEYWNKIYEYALKNDFRFLSYGDGCLIFV